MTEQNGQPDCIVITAPDVPLDDALRRELATRHRAIRSVSDPFHGFAQLCLAERMQSSRSAWGLQRAVPPMLVITAPLSGPVLDTLLAARDRYMPTVAVQRWRDGSLHELRAAAGHQPAAPDGQPVPPAPARPGEVAPVVQPRAAQNPQQHLRLTEPMRPAERMAERTPQDSDADDERAAVETDADTSDRPAALSAEEVQMLLGTEEGPANP